MKKKSNTWIAAGLLTIVAAVTTIYCLLEFRSSVLAVGLSCLFLLGAALWLFLSIAKMQKQEPTVSVGEEQRERMNYEGMKLQGEELIRLVNTLGKGTYVYSKRSAEHLEELLNQAMQNQQANEALIQTLIQEQTKAAKFQVKYNQDDTARLIGSLTENCNQINSNFEKCIETLATQSSDSNSMANSNVTASLTDLSKELARINSSIQALQIQMTAVAHQPMVQQVSPIATPVFTPEAVATPNETAVEVTPVEEATTEEPITEAPFTTDDTAAIAAEVASFFDSFESVAEESTVVEETIKEEAAPVEEAAPIFEVVTPMTETVVPEAEVAPIDEPAPAEEPAPVDISSMVSDDPNKQLSADEIAALFAALG
ncbi:MAG: hypothetical protein IJ040_04260 [Lachnospiraceae bacterium]|nr:hypothetical protein [Lachnospiraceae bacterium]